MADKLRAVAEPGEMDRLQNSTILRHATGEKFPSHRMQVLYVKATDNAVRPDDHVQTRDEYLTKIKCEREGHNYAEAR